MDEQVLVVFVVECRWGLGVKGGDVVVTPRARAVRLKRRGKCCVDVVFVVEPRPECCAPGLPDRVSTYEI